MKVLERLQKIVRAFRSTPPKKLDISQVRIYEKDKIPDLTGFEQMKWYAIDAYPYQHETDSYGSGDFSEDARGLAIRTVARHYAIPVDEVLGNYEVCIVPGIGFHGHIMARQR